MGYVFMIRRSGCFLRRQPMMDIRTLFAKRLKQLRVESGYSISELAAKAGISRQHIRELELTDNRKRVTITSLERLAKAFEIPVSKFLELDGEDAQKHSNNKKDSHSPGQKKPGAGKRR